MVFWARLWGVLAATLSMLLDVAQFWKEVSRSCISVQYIHDYTRALAYLGLQRCLVWWRSGSPKERLLHCLATAETFEEWEDAAFQLDELLGTDDWYLSYQFIPLSSCCVWYSITVLTCSPGAKIRPARTTTIGSSSKDWNPLSAPGKTKISSHW